MWIFTTSGFISAVRNPNDRTIIVRARDRESLTQISLYCKTTITLTQFADYPYRIVISPEKLIEWINNEIKAIDYSNFKNRVKITRGNKFEKALTQVWNIMHNIEDAQARTEVTND